MLVLQDIAFILAVPLRKRWVDNIQRNSKCEYELSTQSCFEQWIRNALEAECPRNLKGPMIKSRCKEGSMKIGVCGFLSTPELENEACLYCV